MPEKIYSIMCNYIPKDINTIQTSYLSEDVGSSIMSNTHLPELDLILKLYIAIRVQPILSEIA